MGETLLALFIYDIPSIILLIILAVVGNVDFDKIVEAVTFILTELFYSLLILSNIIKNGFEWFYLAWILQISGFAFLAGALFWINWNKKNFKKIKKNKH